MGFSQIHLPPRLTLFFLYLLVNHRIVHHARDLHAVGPGRVRAQHDTSKGLPINLPHGSRSWNGDGWTQFDEHQGFGASALDQSAPLLPESVFAGLLIRIRQLNWGQVFIIVSSTSTSFQARGAPPKVIAFSALMTWAFRRSIRLRFIFSMALWFMWVTKWMTLRGMEARRSRSAINCICNECPSGPGKWLGETYCKHLYHLQRRQSPLRPAYSLRGPSTPVSHLGHTTPDHSGMKLSSLRILRTSVSLALMSSWIVRRHLI